MTEKLTTTEFYAKDRAAWRSWLRKNHRKEKYVWLVMFKKESGVSSVVYAEAVEEALCFGWIDSKPNKRDADSYMQFFTSRKPGSPWSKINKGRITRLIREKKMTAAGMKKIDAAKRDGSWVFLDKVERLQVPPDLKKLFDGNKQALRNFEAFPPSVRKSIILWVESARREETRKKRIKEIVTLAGKNIRANQWRP